MQKLEKLNICLTKSIENMEIIPSEGSKKVRLEDIGGLVKDGDIILTFANLCLDQQELNNIANIFNKINGQSVQDYIVSVYNTKSLKYNEVVADVIMINMVNETLKSKKQKDIAQIKTLLLKELKEICITCQTYADLAVRATLDAKDGNRMHMYALALELTGRFGDNDSYGVYPCFIDGMVSLCDIFTITEAHAAIDFDLASIAKEKIDIKKCENCGKYFIPTSRSDEIYCDNIYKNEKTCKELGY